MWTVVTVSAIAVGLGVFITEYQRSDAGKYDERQLIARGQGANLAMNIGYAYLLGMFAGCGFRLIRTAYLPIIAIYGLSIMTISYHGYCIFHDAYLNREQSLRKELRRYFTTGILWAGLALVSGKRGSDGFWIEAALALNYLSVSLMLLLRELVLRSQDRRAAKDEWDG